MQSLGRHLIVEMWACHDDTNSTDIVRDAMTEAIDAINATLLNLHIERFQPHGVTGLAVLAESHFSVHSWPEHGYVAADIFTCGTTAQPERAIDILRKHFQPEHVEAYEVSRGIPPELKQRLQLKNVKNSGSETISSVSSVHNRERNSGNQI
ncbi:MAG: hypothetical protein Tsb009_00340 [Planctomycetaceae bacterium]